MSCNNCRTLLLFLIASFFVGLLPAQQNAVPASEGFKLFFEKVYLHTDRSWYASGDDIWFKAYLVNARDNIPFNTSNNLYVELIDPGSEIISRKVIRLDSVGVGDFRLEDSIAGGTFRIRAYTNWMRNFGNHFIFEKNIQVVNIPGLKKGAAPVTRDGSNSTKKTISTSNKIRFFPEAGTMVEDVPATIAFKAEDGQGNGVNAKGILLSKRGDTVARFTTTHLGMGSFTFTPKARNEYTAMVQYNSSGFTTTTFPTALPNGFVMKVTRQDVDTLFISVMSNPATKRIHPTGIMTLTARHAGKSFYREQIQLANGRADVSVPASDFPMGIAYLTLYDESMHPHSERLVFIQGRNPVNMTISADKSAYGPKEKTTLNLLVTDSHKRPVKASFSMAVVDNALDKLPPGNIISHLMLESDLQGKIERPATYFDKGNTARFQQLDLLLSTQGWRSFLWRQLADTNIRIAYLPEPGITISGKVTRPSSNKTLEDMSITLFAPGAKGNKIYMTKTNTDGRYYLDGLPLYGIQTIKLNAGDAAGKRIGAIKMDIMFNNPLAVEADVGYAVDTSRAFDFFAKEAKERWSKFGNDQWFNILPGVTVTDKRGTTILRDGSAAMSFGYPEYNFTITPKDYEHARLRDFIVQKVPGAMYDDELEGVTFLQNGKPVRPVLIVNKKQDVFERLDYYSLSMQQINSVKVRHLVGSPTYISGVLEEATEEVTGAIASRGIRDIFLVTLDVKPGNYDQQLSKLNVDITGYYEARVFYPPDYSIVDKAREDRRITIHWEPLIETDDNGKATVGFYNADPKGTIRVNVEGITSNGVPVAAGTKYEVK